MVPILICELFLLFYGNAGPTFINLSYREQDYTSANECTEEPSGQNKESSFCKANIWFPSAALAGQIFRCQRRCSRIGTMCTDTDGCPRRLSATNRVHGQCFLILCPMAFGQLIKLIYPFGWFPMCIYAWAFRSPVGFSIAFGQLAWPQNLALCSGCNRNLNIPLFSFSGIYNFLRQNCVFIVQLHTSVFVRI